MINLTKFDKALKIIYEIVNLAGYSEDDISEVAKAIEDINLYRDELATYGLKLLVKESEITSLNDEIEILKIRLDILDCNSKSKFVNNQNLHNEINRLSIENIHLKRKIAEMELMQNAWFSSSEKFKKYRVINYWIQQSLTLAIDVEYKIFGHTLVNGGVVELGKYSSLCKAKKVFEEMIKAEEMQKSFKADYYGTEFGDFGVTTLRFKIFKMPLEDEVI